MSCTADKHLIDTNVLIVASAADCGSPLSDDCTPVDEGELRLKVLSWLQEFHGSDRKVILDFEWRIISEYKGENRRTPLTDQDYGLQVILHKHSTGQTEPVMLAWDENRNAVIPDHTLHGLIHDPADRKMVAAVLKAGGAANGCNLINACDTDWYDWEEPLLRAGVEVEQLIGEEWCRPRWERKRG